MKTLKIVVVGPYHAGKSIFLQTSRGIGNPTAGSNLPVDNDIKQISSVATDVEKILLDDDMMIFLFGMPGQQRFDFMWDVLEDKIHGFIILFDNERPETFIETQKIIDMVHQKTNTPFILCGTSADPEKAWGEEALRRSFSLASQFKYTVCQLDDLSSVKKTILDLLYEILNKYEG